MTKFELNGARVLITGAGSGIGKLLAIAAASQGAEIILWDLNLEAAKGVSEHIVRRGGKASAQQVDISDPKAVSAAASVAGEIDVLVNNAGIVTGKHLLESSPEEIQKTYAVNTLSLYWTTQAFLGGMIERNHGKVVTVASAAGLIGVAKQSDYSASKHAAVGFSESLRAELRTLKSKVTTLTFCPYYINTGMFEGVRTRFPLILPILDQKRVVRRVIRSIQNNDRMLVLPWIVRLIPAMRLLPVPLFDALADLLGINQTMDKFTGRR
ncbi:MAG: SDR family oxidoreductase [Microbacteriaceae bacterium]